MKSALLVVFLGLLSVSLAQNERSDEEACELITQDKEIDFQVFYEHIQIAQSESSGEDVDKLIKVENSIRVVETICKNDPSSESYILAEMVNEGDLGEISELMPESRRFPKWIHKVVHFIVQIIVPYLNSLKPHPN